MDCFYELDKQLVIHPDDCIDCMACVDQCPVGAIYADDDVPEQEQDAIEFNANEATRLKDEGYEAIVTKQDPLPTAEERKKELGY